jgi:hypothetical protein
MKGFYGGAPEGEGGGLQAGCQRPETGSEKALDKKEARRNSFSSTNDTIVLASFLAVL